MSVEYIGINMDAEYELRVLFYWKQSSLYSPRHSSRGSRLSQRTIMIIPDSIFKNNFFFTFVFGLGSYNLVFGTYVKVTVPVSILVNVGIYRYMGIR